MASVIKVLLERRCIPAFRSPVFDTTSPGGGRQTETAQMCVTGISPLRGSLRAAPIKMAGQEYHYHPDEVIAKQLVMLFCGQMGTARRLIWPSFMRGNRTGGSWRILQSRFVPVGHFVRERISVAGYDRAGPVFVKVRQETLCPSNSLLQLRKPKTELIFLKTSKQIFQRLFCAS